MKYSVKSTKNKNFKEDNAQITEPGNQYQFKSISEEGQTRIDDKTFYIQVSKINHEVQSKQGQ